MQRINYGAARAKATDTGQGGTKQDGRRALTQPPCSLQGQSCCSCCSSPSPCTVLQVSHLMGHRRRSGLGVPTGDVLLGSLGKKPSREQGQCCWQEEQPPGRGRAARPRVRGRTERVLGGLSKASPGEMLQELGGDAGSRCPGLSWMSKFLEGGSMCSCLEPPKTPCKLCSCLDNPQNLVPRPNTPTSLCTLAAAAMWAVGCQVPHCSPPHC